VTCVLNCSKALKVVIFCRVPIVFHLFYRLLGCVLWDEQRNNVVGWPSSLESNFKNLQVSVWTFFVYVCFFVFFFFFFFCLSQLLVMSCFICVVQGGNCFVCFFSCEKMLVETKQSCFLYVCLMQGHSGYVCVLSVVVLWNEWRSSVITWGGWTWCWTWSLTKSFWVGRLFGCFVTTCFKLFCVLWQLFHSPPPPKILIIC